MNSSTPDNFTIPPISEREKLLRKIDHRDKLSKSLNVLISILVVMLVIYGQIDVRHNLADHRYQVETITDASTEQLRKAASANRTRLDVNLCIVSVPPQTRTPEYVHKCYDDAERVNNVKIERFGYGQ